MRKDSLHIYYWPVLIENMSNGRIYTKILKIKGIFRLCFLIIFVNICIAGFLQYYARETDNLPSNIKYIRSDKQLGNQFFFYTKSILSNGSMFKS